MNANDQALAPGDRAKAARPTPGPVRVLHVYSGNLHGGVEAMLATLARLRETTPGMEPHYAACFAGRSSEEIAASGVPVHVLGALRARNPLGILRARRRLAELIRRERFDVVICHLSWAQAILGPAVRAAGAPLVMWMHDPPEERPHWTDRWARRTRPDFVICNSRYTAERLGRLYPGVASALIYCPVAPAPPRSPRERSETRSELGVPDGGTVILQVGRWGRHKGHLLHMEALARLSGRRDWACWQVGGVQRPEEAAYVEEVRALAERLGIGDRVRFLGRREDLGRLLAASDVYCQPNVGPEPFGIACIEALYAGLPVVSTPLGGPAEIVTGACGVLVPPGDPAALAGALEALIDDPDRRARLGEGGPARARELCDPAAVLARLEGVLAGLVRP
jgi:glycosyltransferase involved in cell wall biosynthesis